MARTVSAVHAIRRDAFVDVAQRLIQAKGYEQMSVQDVLDELDASRGAFYHYFDSKVALLDAVVERMVVAGMASVAPVVADPNLPALAKLQRVFSGIADWKAQRRELVLALLEVWYSDDNAIVRDKLRQRMVAGLTPMLAAIIRQGTDEGAFSTSPPDDAARVVVALLQGGQDLASELFFAHQAGAITLETIESRLGAYSAAFERILGIPAGSLRLVDSATLRLWFH